MMMKRLAAAGIISALPFAVNAATVDSLDFEVGDDLTIGLDSSSAGSVNINANEGDSFSEQLTFTANERLRLNGQGTINNIDEFVDLEILANGNQITEFDDGAGDTTTFDLPSLLLEVNDSFTINTTFTDILQDGAEIDYAIETSAVPVPASAVLFGTALTGLGFAARRRKS